MRVVPNKERKQRGCEYCLRHKGKRCKYSKCPYHVLDKVKDYEEYMDHIGLSDSLLIDVFNYKGDKK